MRLVKSWSGMQEVKFIEYKGNKARINFRVEVLGFRLVRKS